MYFVPNLGPSILMNEDSAAYAERIGGQITRREFKDFDRAKVFADRILSTVEDKKGTVLYDARNPAEGTFPRA